MVDYLRRFELGIASNASSSSSSISSLSRLVALVVRLGLARVLACEPEKFNVVCVACLPRAVAVDREPRADEAAGEAAVRPDRR